MPHAYAVHTQISMDFLIYLVENLRVSHFQTLTLSKNIIDVTKTLYTHSQVGLNTLFFIMLLLLIQIHLQLTYCQNELQSRC